MVSMMYTIAGDTQMSKHVFYRGQLLTEYIQEEHIPTHLM